MHLGNVQASQAISNYISRLIYPTKNIFDANDKEKATPTPPSPITLMYSALCHNLAELRLCSSESLITHLMLLKVLNK